MNATYGVPARSESARVGSVALRSRLALGAILLVLGGTAGTAALEGQVPAPHQNGPIALVGGTVHPVSGPSIQGGTVLFEDGVILAVGASVTIPDDAERIDVTGLHVYPGLVDAFSQMGLYEIGQVEVTLDVNERGSINPNVRPELAVNPESRHIGTTRSNGVLVAVTTPSGGLIPGLSAALMLEGWSWEEMTIRAPVALNVNWPNPSNEEGYEVAVRELREIFETARAYRDARRAGQEGRGPAHPFDSRWEAMIPALDGEIPVVVAANDLRQIQDAVAWAGEADLRLVLRGGADAVYVADHLARREVPVILAEVLGSPSRAWEPYDAVYARAARLHEAGVPIAIAGSSSAPYANRLPYEAGAAVAFGLPLEEALRAVTVHPARILGIDDRIGALETGRDATLIITTGHPLEYATTIERAFVQGRDLDLMDAHRQFFERYMEKVRQSAAR